MPDKLSIVVVESDRERALLIVDSLRETGDYDIFVLSEVTGLARRIQERNPDLVLVDISSPTRDMLEEMALASGPLDRPVAMFVDRSDDSLTKAAIEAGVSAYVVDGLRADRIKPILDAAIARFHMFHRMRAELAATKTGAGRAQGDRPRQGRVDEGPWHRRGRGLCADPQDGDGPGPQGDRRRPGAGHRCGAAVVSAAPLTAGYIPLVDAAPLVIAREIGFAEEEGLALCLRPAPSWATLRDLLALGQIEAAQLLAPIPIAMALGLSGMPTRLDALMVLSVNGDVIGVSRALAARMRAAGYRFDFADAAAAGRALIAASASRPRIGVPFPFSMHAELLYYWLGALGVSAPQAIEVRTVPPPLMAEAMAAGEIDAFCVGAPWGSVAVESGAGELLLPGCAIWKFAPEKVLAVRHDWAAAEPGLTGRLMRAVWRAGRWLGHEGNWMTASEILARPDYLNLPAEVIERSLSGRLVISPRGESRRVEGYLEFFRAAASFPWKSQAAWIAGRLAARTGLDRGPAVAAARDLFRTDLYRHNLAGVGAELPGASEKLEGAMAEARPASSASGKLILGPDNFFDGHIFDPEAPE